uniref:Chromosome 4 open reading frame 36 n=1 Tax=Homo sapiens TaxID=9606 RepID=D6RCP1_HUMAN
MAYGVPRKNTVKTILRGSCYNVVSHCHAGWNVVHLLGLSDPPISAS